VINVGGNKVHPEKVESVLMQVKDVLQVKVYAKTNSVIGALVAADVVTSANADWPILLKNIREHCKLTLQRFEIPVKLQQVESIEVNASGKLSRSTSGD
jgi:acyl-CoA synthetase (AMP-forming)/AMP-acid ligase II